MISGRSNNNTPVRFTLSGFKKQKVSRQTVIESGMIFLQEIEADRICNVCIANGGSCCNGCRHLVDGAGCQLRNTSCTGWLCGFLKYLLYETGHLQEWKDFWAQVPGQSFREDFTPPAFFIKKTLSHPDIRDLSEALAADLQEISQTQMAIGFIITLRENIDKSIDQLDIYKKDPMNLAMIKGNIAILSRHFKRFHEALKVR